MSQPSIHNPSCETMAREEIEQLQIERLQVTLNRAYANVAHYRAAFDAAQVNLENVVDLDALAELPFTTRDDLRQSYPYGMFAVPLKDILRVHWTAGAGGPPIVVGYTQNDLRHWTECTARLLAAAGITEHDVVQIALDYGLYAGGFGFQQGAELLGASVIPVSLSAGVDKQVAILRDFKSTALVTTPSHAVAIAAALRDHPPPTGMLRLRTALLGGEPWSDALRRQIEGDLHVRAIDTYGLTEIMGPGMAGECHAQRGHHVNEDHFIVEVIDPRTLRRVEPGRQGELVVTTITKEGFPLIRYRTGDVTTLVHEPCVCGRTLVRIARIASRTDDLVVFHGIAFSPAQIGDIVRQVEDASPHYQIILDRKDGIDSLEVRVAVSENIPAMDELKTLDHLRTLIARRIKTALDVDAKVTFVEPGSLRQAANELGSIVDRRPS
jgi:phenylacetate-CoA ligase